MNLKHALPAALLIALGASSLNASPPPAADLGVMAPDAVVGTSIVGVLAASDLRISAFPQPSPVPPGGLLVVNLMIDAKNATPIDDVSVDLSFPVGPSPVKPAVKFLSAKIETAEAGAACTSFSTPPGPGGGTAVEHHKCTFNTMFSDETHLITMKFKVLAPAPGPVALKAVVSSADGSFSDGLPSNNTANISVPVGTTVATPPGGSPDSVSSGGSSGSGGDGGSGSAGDGGSSGSGGSGGSGETPTIVDSTPSGTTTTPPTTPVTPSATTPAAAKSDGGCALIRPR